MKIKPFFILSFILLLGTESLAQSSFNNAIDFDGNGDYANTFNSPYFPTDNGTLEAWVKVRSIILPENIQSIGEAFVAKNEEQWNTGDFYVYFDYATGLLKSRIQAPPSVQIDVRSNINFWQYYDIWFHYAFTWGSDGMKMYLNGELQSDQNSLTYSALNNNYNFYIGAHGYMLHNGSYVVADFFDGQIDELRIWNSQKTSEGILALWDSPLDSSYFVTIDSGLVGYWRFDELEDLGINNDGVDDVRDFSVLQNHLDLAGNAHLVTSNIVSVDPDIFEKTFGGVSSERGIVFDITNDGGYIISGSTSSFSSDQDMYLVKLDSTASLEWSKVYHSSGFIDRLHGVRQTVEGNYYLSGYVEGGFGFLDIVVLKVNSAGDLIWAKNFGGTEADELRGISITQDGGVLVSGYNASFGAGLKDIQVIKFFSDGSIDWAKNFGTIWEDHNLANIISADGNFIFCGATDITGNLDWRPTLIKADTLGNILWAKYYPGFSDDWSRNVIETFEGGYLIVGETRSYGLGGSEDIYLIKTSVSGNVEWAKAYGGIGNERGYGILQNSEGKYIIAGYTNSFGFGGYDAFLMKVDVIGNLEWFHTYGGNTNDYASDVKETSDNGFALIGRRSTNTFGSDDVYLIKTDQDGNSSCEFGTFNANVFDISNLVAVDISMSTSSTISVADLNLTVINPNTAENILCGIIPVELKSFLYEIEGNKVLLKWSTATETNNMGFRINRDGEEIGFIPGVGTTTEPQNYSFADENVENGTYLYSLIQIDYDGSTENIGAVEIIINNTPNEYSLLQNFPNPFNPSTIISYTVPERIKVVLKVYDVLGTEVAELINDIKSPGRYEVEFNSKGLPSGIYFYTIQAGKFTNSKKMILLK